MFPKGLIVSSQALDGNPLKKAEYLAVMAHAAALGGAVALRANGASDIAEMRRRVDIPIIGIDKRKDASGRVVITPDFAGAKRVVEAGATIVALEVTDYPSDIREDRPTLIRRIHEELHALVMADISTLEEAKAAAAMGVDAVSTTLAGYIPGALHTAQDLYTPDFTLLRQIAEAGLPCALVAEGRLWEKKDLRRAFELGADAVVIGKAVTNPMAITRYFCSALPNGKYPLSTEAANPDTVGISDADTAGILRMINAADATVASVVAENIPQIARMVEAAVKTVQDGGRIFYVGAGTSGRLAIADAAECPPTYGLSPEIFTAVIAGGPGAILRAAEGCEDSVERGKEAFAAAGVKPGDFVLGISAAGRAPFVLSFMAEAAKCGCTVAAMVNNRNTEMAGMADIAVTLLTGPEVICGSTRMKAGTSQKMALNMFSTAVCIRLGCTYRHYMVNMTPSNRKLRARAIGMVCEITGMDEKAAEALLSKHDFHIKNALKEIL